MKKGNKGFTLIELLIVVAIIGIIAAIAVPGLLRARMSGNESSAIGSMRAITSAQATYASACGGGFYAPGLADLGTPPVAGQAPFISPDLGFAGAANPVSKSGYDVSMTGTAAANSPASCNGVGAAAGTSGYKAWADPQSSSTGTRFFFTNTMGTVYQHTASLSGEPENTAPGAGAPIQ